MRVIREHRWIPAFAGMTEEGVSARAARTDYHPRFRGNDILGAFAVIPAKAGIHGRSSLTHDGAPDTPIASVPSVIAAKAGIHGR